MKEDQESAQMAKERIEVRDEQAARWFATMRRGVMSVDDQAALAVWRQDARNQAALDDMYTLWNGVAAARPAATSTHAAEPSRRHTLRAASIAAVLFLASAGLYMFLRPAPWDGEIRTAIGEQRAVTLADGSLLQLNVASVARWRFTAPCVKW